MSDSTSLPDTTGVRLFCRHCASIDEMLCFAAIATDPVVRCHACREAFRSGQPIVAA